MRRTPFFFPGSPAAAQRLALRPAAMLLNLANTGLEASLSKLSSTWSAAAAHSLCIVLKPHSRVSFPSAEHLSRAPDGHTTRR